MAAQMVQKTATITCDHQGQVQVQPVSGRVKVAGQYAVHVPFIVPVSGCPLQSGSSPVPCATITYNSGTTRVKSLQQFFLLDSSSGTAIGPAGNQGGGPINGVQTRVAAK